MFQTIPTETLNKVAEKLSQWIARTDLHDARMMTLVYHERIQDEMEAIRAELDRRHFERQAALKARVTGTRQIPSYTVVAGTLVKCGTVTVDVVTVA